MPMTKSGYIFLIGVIVFAVVISLLSYFIAYEHALELSSRLFALNGFLALSVAAIMTAFLKEITLLFKKPFLRLHHYFAAIGIVLITLHPVTLFIQSLNPAIFLPNFSSINTFFVLGGRPALIIIYIAVAFVLLRRQIPKYWRIMHALIYVALFIGIVHANLSGTDFQNLSIVIIYNALFAAVLVSFALKRLQQYRLIRRVKANKRPPK